jgi:hypothetical protein
LRVKIPHPRDPRGIVDTTEHPGGCSLTGRRRVVHKIEQGSNQRALLADSGGEVHSALEAMVADNDLALGRIVEGISKSQFWPHSLILVVEDDAQDGVDHVDGHRTVALAIGR